MGGSWTAKIILGVIVGAVLAVLLLAGFQRSQGERSKLESASGRDCEKVGVIAVFGGRSSLYRCASTTGTNCDVWVDGAAYNVTKNARALFKLQGVKPPC